MGLLSHPGDLSRTPLAAILLEALNVRVDGVLEVTHTREASRIWFREGRPVGASVFQGFRPLGQMLLEAGRIDVDALSRSLARMAESGRPQGEILVEMGVCSQEDVDAMLEIQQSSYFNVIASLDSGTYSFTKGIPIPQWTRSSRLYPLRTIVDALEKPQASGLVASALEPVQKGGVRLSTGYQAVADFFRWTPLERAWVDRLVEPTKSEEALARRGLSDERARAVLAGLLLLGLAVSTAEQPVATGKTNSGLGDATPAPVGEPTVLGRRSDPVEARKRRQRLLRQAIRNMGIVPFAPRPEGSPAPQRTPKGAAGSSDQFRPGSPEAKLKDALLKLAPRARSTDFFERLGLSENATRDDVKKAFISLAKQFHPDRFMSPALAGLKDIVRDFFAAVNEAYQTLSDDRRRAEYVQKRQGARIFSAESARVDFEKAEACFRTKDFAGARSHYEAAVRGDPKAEYQAALAQVLVAGPVDRDLDRAHQLVESALKDTRSDRAFYVAGLLALEEKNEASAEKMFRQAVRLNSRNAEAARELKAVQAKLRIVDPGRRRD